jgi:glutaconate CoA-transferase subunit B
VSYRIEELLIVTIADLLRERLHVAVGAASPIPGAGALLARERSPALRVSVLGSEGGRELFDCAAQGRIDAFFLGGAQIDGGANINLVGIGDYPAQSVRFPGSFGSAYLYFLVPNVILFSLAHSQRNLVSKVDFVSAPGTSEERIYRPGGPRVLLTSRCLFDFDQSLPGFRLRSVHPGETIETVTDNTGFEFDIAGEVAVTRTPTDGELDLIRGSIGAAIGETYPTFARTVLGIRC